MIRRIATLAFAASCLAAPAAVPAQPPQQPPEPPAAGSAGGESLIILSESHHQDGQGAKPAGSGARDGQPRIYTVRPNGGTFEIHAGDGTVYRVDRDDGGAFVVNAKDGTTYRVGHGDNGVLVLRAKDGHTYRVDGVARHAIVLRGREGETFRVGQAPLVLKLRQGGGHPYQLSALESCGGVRPLVDQSSADGHDRTKIVICDGQASGADNIARLEHVLERVQHMDALSDASRERVAAALREAIEQLRSAH
ncbi:MAG TPA: hypothetical protein VH331_10260 [Allosphingosinicella sp.]|jgi:hypothetical protein|nr:hypothetical protein [Allosphingosinicella sp.]